MPHQKNTRSEPKAKETLINALKRIPLKDCNIKQEVQYEGKNREDCSLVHVADSALPVHRCPCLLSVHYAIHDFSHFYLYMGACTMLVVARVGMEEEGKPAIIYTYLHILVGHCADGNDSSLINNVVTAISTLENGAHTIFIGNSYYFNCYW